MSARSIYIRLVQAGMSAVGACAMMGNMQAESAMRANNVQDGMGYTDGDYTAAVDAGRIDFINDQRGYGLCQWTYPGRKRNLLSFARQRGVSIGDEAMQVDFCIQELRTEYPALWLYLCEATGVYEAAERICKEYERPAVNNVDVRAQAADNFYMQFGGMEVPKISTGDSVDKGSQDTSSVTANAVPPSPKGEGKGAGEGFWPPRVLAYGMYGPDVVALQGLLIAHGFPAGISGQFNNATVQQLAEFQRAAGLAADSIAGPLSWAALVKGV